MTTEEKRQSDETNIAVIANDIIYIKKSIDDITEKLQQDLVTKVEFEPVKRLVYGLVSLILVAVVGTIMALVLQK